MVKHKLVDWVGSTWRRRAELRQKTRAAATVAASRLFSEPLESRVLLAATLPAGFTESLIATGLASPTAMEFASDGRIFVTQQDGNLRVIKNGQLLSAPFVSLHADSTGERGLLGVVADPNFASNKFLYVYYTTTDGGASHNRVSRFTATADTAPLSSETVLLDMPAIGGGAWHMGGAMRFGLDGKLFVAVGDYEVPSNAQLMTTPAGKLLRINPDGTIPTDNPFYSTTTGVNQAIWALGLRNPFTLAVEPGTGRLFINDVGQSAYEEIDQGSRGANYGWPGSEGPTPISGYTSPVYAYDHNLGICIVGGAFYSGVTQSFPSQYAGQYFFGDFGNGWVKTLNPATGQVSDFASNLAFPTGFAVGGDGTLWYLSRGAPSGGIPNTGSVYKIAYDAFSPPKINAQPTKQVVSAGDPATFQVSASGSGTVTYQWYRNSVAIGGATTNTYSLTTTTLADNNASFTCTIANAYGSVTTQPATLTVTTNKRPTATILTPTNGAIYAAGDTINYSATATDTEDGTLPASAYTWQINYYTGIVARPFLLPTSGITGGSFVFPVESPYTEANVYFRITLTVVDSTGLTYTTTTDVLPKTASLTLTTNVPGTKVEIDGQPKAAPYTTIGVAGLHRSIGAQPIQVVNGETWQFDHWSDGGDATHPLNFPSSNTTLTAVYRKRQTVYVSDLPYLGTPTNKWGPVEKDLSNGDLAAGDGKPITLNGTVYTKGLGTNADSEIDYALNGQYETFLADVGIDDEVGNAGSVVFQVWADGAKLFESSLRTGFDATVPINVDVRGKQNLQLIASTGGDDGTFDHGDWAAARLVVPEPTTTPNPVYASDIPFAGTPVNGWGPIERDKSNGESAANDGRIITLNGVTYAKGIGTHANSQVVLPLGGRFTTFQSDIGVDDEEGVNGSVVFQVWGDGVQLYDSGVMTGSTATKSISVPVVGVQQLKLVTTDAGDNNFNDHADWAGAKIIPASIPPAVFVSDLPFVGTLTNAWGPVERDKSNGENAAGDGTTITLNGIQYLKGIGTHANSEVNLDLAGTYANFHSDIGIDDEQGNNGSVVFQVWADGVKIYDSGVMYGASATKTVDLSVVGVQRLSLVTTDSGDNNFNDHADWAGASVTPLLAAPKTAYVSDLPFVGTLLNGWGPIERDKSNGESAAGDGKTITLNGVTYVKGLGTHANAEVDFALDGAYANFHSDIGVDDETGVNGSVVFQVWGDGLKLYDSGTMGGSTATKTVDLSVAGVKRLALVTTDSGDNNYNDHADWAGATLTLDKGSFAVLPAAEVPPPPPPPPVIIPSATIADASIVEGNTGLSNLVFTVTRSSSASPSSVSYTTAEASATVADGDYAAVSGTLLFAIGELSKTISVPITGDMKVENNETFTIQLASPTNLTLAATSATGTIANDDYPGISIADASVIEGNSGSSTLSFVVSRTDGTLASSVNWATSNATATAGVDYTAGSGTLTFAAGELSKTVTVSVIGDSAVEPDEALYVTLSSPTNATIGRTQAAGAIVNDDFPSVSIADASIIEGNSGTANLSFVVTRTDGTLASSVNWSTSNATATAGTDYTAASGSLSFAPGELSKTLTVSVIGDTTVEQNESLFVTLSSPTNATISRAQAAGAIVNDDFAGISIADASVTEGNSGTANLSFVVSRSDATLASSVNWSTSGGTATAGTDYTASSGTLNFAAGELSKTITVSVVGDVTVEPTETMLVTLASPTAATLARSQATGTIVNDDVSTISVTDTSVTEGNTGTADLSFVVTRNDGSVPATVNWSTGGGTASAGTDYTAISGTVSFAVGELSKTVLVKVTSDTVVESDETVLVTLSNPIAQPTLITTIQAEDYNVGGEGVGYHDLDAANQGGAYRTTEGVDLEACVDTGGGYNLAYTLAGEWVNYSINVPAAGTYVISPRVASAVDGGVFHLEVDGVNVSGAMTMPNTGAWQTYTTLNTLPISLSAGKHTMRLAIDASPNGAAGNFNYFNISAVSVPVLARAQATGTIINDDFQTISIADASTTEGNSGTKALTFTLTRSNSTGAATVQWATSNGTATTADADYVAAAGTISFANGELTKTISVNLTGDTKVEGNETFLVTLSNPVGATLSSAQAIATIVNDDITPILMEAESATLKGTAVSRTSTGYSGTGYVAFNLLAASGSAITWGPNVAVGGTRTLQIRYSSGTGTPNLKLVVNGITVNSAVSFPSTGGSTRWSVVTLSVSLLTGANTIALVSNGGLFSVNIDSLTVS